MDDEKDLMQKLDEIVSNGYGDALFYGCDIAVNAALKGYQRSERRLLLTGMILAFSFSLVDKVVKKAVMKHQKSKTKDDEES